MAQIAAENARAEAAASSGANPAPLGLSAFALTTFVLSCVNAGFLIPQGTGGNIVVGLALFYGGLAQLLAGMWEFRSGNTFGATAFSSFGAFWLAYGTILLPGTGVLDALTKANVFHPAAGIFLLAWAIFTFLMLLGSLRINLALIALFLFLTLTFLALAIGELGGGVNFQIIGGWLGIVTALIAWYTALAGILSSAKSVFTLPVWPRG
ncbi:MAG TPA: acetate uptake transporter [Ktedonobacteraceae bacterium]|nr:acetate uptake transporter [Ktedonobacteraceae bacterium]